MPATVNLISKTWALSSAQIFAPKSSNTARQMKSLFAIWLQLP